MEFRLRYSRFLKQQKTKDKIGVLIHIGPSLRVVVKSDIEGGELAVVTDMVVTGAMESVDNLHMEWHGVNGPGFIRTGEEAEMIDQLADAVSEVSLSPSTYLFPR